MRPHLLLATSLLGVVACSNPPPKGPEKKLHQGPLHWYPLDVGNTWSFTVREVKGGPAILIVTKVVAFDGQLALLQTGTAESTLRVTPDAIVREPSGSVLLRVPPKLGDKWAGATGSAIEITKTDVALTTEAGRFEGCVETTELFGGDDMRITRTTFCPEVGPVMLDVRPAGLSADAVPQGETAKLRSFGPSLMLPAGSR
jgi:hypothetical protein